MVVARPGSREWETSKMRARRDMRLISPFWTACYDLTMRPLLCARMWGNQRIWPSVSFPWDSTRVSDWPHAVLKPHQPILTPSHHQPPFYRSAFHLAVCEPNNRRRYTPMSIQDLFLCSFVCASIADGARDGIFGFGSSPVGWDGLAEEFHWVCHPGRIQRTG